MFEISIWILCLVCIHKHREKTYTDPLICLGACLAAVDFVVVWATHFLEVVTKQLFQVILTGDIHYPKVRVLTGAAVTIPAVSLQKLSDQIVQLFILSASQGCKNRLKTRNF